MRWDLFGRYVLEFAMLYPGALLCYLPMRRQLRLSLRGLTALVIGGVTAAVVLCAAICSSFACPSNMLLLPVMVGMFLAYRRTLPQDTSLGKAVYLFTTTASLLAACTMLTCLLNAARELHNTDPVFSASSSIMCLGLSALMGSMLYPLIQPWHDWLVEEFHFVRVWRIAWVLPTCFTCMYMLMLPRHPATVLVNRVQVMGVVLVLAALSVQFLLIFLLYRIARETTANARLTAENQLLTVEARRYQELRNHMEETRLLRHDFRQHLRVTPICPARGTPPSWSNTCTN